MKTQVNCCHCQKSIYRLNSEIARSLTGNFFCSRSCAAIVNNKSTIKRERTKKCKQCKSLILSGYTYCDKCYVEKHYLSHKTLNEAIALRTDANRYTGIRGNGRNVFYASNKLHCCAYCGYDKHIEICHIKDICEFDPQTLISIINDIDNLIALCPNHHWEFDHGLLTIEQINGLGRI